MAKMHFLAAGKLASPAVWPRWTSHLPLPGASLPRSQNPACAGCVTQSFVKTSVGSGFGAESGTLAKVSWVEFTLRLSLFSPWQLLTQYGEIFLLGARSPRALCSPCFPLCTGP